MRDRAHVYAKHPDETGGCPYCDKAKEWLRQKDIPFTIEELGPEARQRLYDRLGLEGNLRTVPQVMLIDEAGTVHRIGGYAELVHCGVNSLFHPINPHA